MVKRLNVTVPDSLYERMNRFGGRLNWSGEFQKAMDRLLAPMEEKERQRQALIRERAKREWPTCAR